MATTIIIWMLLQQSLNTLLNKPKRENCILKMNRIYDNITHNDTQTNYISNTFYEIYLYQ